MSCIQPKKTEEIKTALMKNKLDYEEMRQRLLETERKLQSLNKLEAEIQVPENQYQSSANRGLRIKKFCADFECEDLESIPSAISTVPGSYQGFNNNHVETSTPSRHDTNNSQNRMYFNYNNGLESDSSFASISAPESKYDLKLLKQNQRLLNEVERLVGEIHIANQKNALLVKDAENGKRVSEYEEKSATLTAENEAQEKKLREAERHLDEGQRRLAELQKRVNFTDTEVVDLRAEIAEIRLVKRELEAQRDDALHNLNKTQDSLEDYQRKTKDKIMMMEEKEDQMQEAINLTSQERDDLLDQLSSMEMTIASQEAQISRLLNDVTEEDKRAQDLNKANHQLRAQLDLMTAQISELELSKKEAKELKKEKENLKSELKSHRAMAKDLKSLLVTLQKSFANGTGKADDSGNFSFKSVPVECVGFGDSAEGGMLAAELNCNNNGLGCCEPTPCEGAASAGQTNMMCEMRNLVSNMDCEIQRLRCDLKQRDADDRTYANLRDELKVLMDKVESGMSHNRDLECQKAQLECDKKSLRGRLEETLGCLEERDRALQCLETRLNERSVQIVCLQEDIDERNCRISALENQIHDLNKRLKECADNTDKGESPALKEARGRIQELEAILLCKNKSLDEMGNKLSETLREFRLLKSDCSSEKECLEANLLQRDTEIQSLKDDVESSRQKLFSLNKYIEEQKQAIRVKEDKISCLQRELEEVKFAAEKTEKILQTQIDDRDKRLKASQDQVLELENALCLCRSEVCSHLKTMDDIRAQYESELEQRDSCIRKLKEDLRCAVEELKCKMEDNGSLERSLAEARSKVHQICGQLKEADTNIQCLNIKIVEMEKQLLKEKSNWMKESEEMDRRMQQCCNNLAIANNEIDILKQHLSEKKGQIDCMQTEKTHMCQEIKKLSDQVCCVQEQIKKMEIDNQELCRQLQQKMECIRDLENVIRSKDHEMKCLTKFVQEMETTGDSGVVPTLEANIKELTEKLAKCTEENKCKGTMLCECEEAFKQCQVLCKDKDSEISLQKCQIEGLNEKLNDRISRVDELERGIENLHKDVERRMMRVDEQLKKYETELADRLQEIATLKECVTTCQLNLSEKQDELQQQEQKNLLLASELESLNLKLRDAEDSRDHLGTQLAEKKGEVSELTQQLRLNREQMQKQHEDLVQCRQALSCSQRDSDKLRRELDDALASLEHRECEISRLNEERKCLMEKVAQISCHMEQDTSMLRNQLAETKCRLEKEMECLRNYSCQVEGNNTSLSNKLSLTQRQMMQMEKCFHQKLDTLNRNFDDLNTKLKVREDELLACKDCMDLKESEITRLKKRLCNAEKVACNANCHNNTCLDDERLCDFSDFQQDDVVISSESCINLAGGDDGDRKLLAKEDPKLDDRAWSEEEDHPTDAHQLSPKSDTGSSRNSLGVTEVQERLRNNQLRQKEIERQLKTLEEGSQEDLSGNNAVCAQSE